jgi:hypothetical protein
MKGVHIYRTNRKIAGLENETVNCQMSMDHFSEAIMRGVFHVDVCYPNELRTGTAHDHVGALELGRLGFGLSEFISLSSDRFDNSHHHTSAFGSFFLHSPAR